jgi:hypothetical protein
MLFLLLASPAAAAPVEIVVAGEALDPRYMDKNITEFARRLEEVGGWRPGTLRGKAFARPREALAYVRKSRAAFAVLPVHQFLEGRRELRLEVLGRALSFEGEFPGYWGVARREKRSWGDVVESPGLTMALTESYDPTWIGMLFESRVDPTRHFKLVEVPSASEAVAAVLAKRADLALLYETDYQALKSRIQSRTDLDWVFTTGALAPPPLVATRFASRADRKRMADAVGKACKGSGADACARVTILYMQPGLADTYAPLIHRYGK